MFHYLYRPYFSVNLLLKAFVRGRYGAGLVEGGICDYSTPSGAANVFDRRSKQHQRNRAAIASDADMYDYLKDKVSGL